MYLNKAVTGILSGFLMLNIYSCKEEPPLFNDGEASLTIVALTESFSSESIIHSCPGTAKVIIASEYGISVKYTDTSGVLRLENFPAAEYDISVKASMPENPSIIFSGSTKINIGNSKDYTDTVILKPASGFGISINEVYYAGPVNNIFYLYDQFIELYNSGEEIKYLDGLIIGRISGNNEGKGPGADEDDDNDIDGATYLFKFPGRPGEKNYPMNSREFIVLAQDAVNHKNSISSSIDLSNAQWEFYNQYSANDVDNPASGNLLNMLPEKTSDFMLGLTGDIIIIATGQDSVWEDGIDISTIIDGIEGQSGSGQLKTLDKRIDKSYIICPGKYSGKSTQRREQGFDSNDGLLDWEIISCPTPGYQ